MQAFPVGVVLVQEPAVPQTVSVVHLFVDQGSDVLPVQIGADQMVVFIREVHGVAANL